MLLPDVVPGHTVHHDIRNSFGRLLEGALRDQAVCVAMGPLYQEDPAAKLIAPFMMSAQQSGWRVDTEEQLAPMHVLRMATHLRSVAARNAIEQMDPLTAMFSLNEWTRAGLVLEVASRRGIHVQSKGVLQVRWKLNGTVTGRFGAETVYGKGPQGSWSFNPLTVPEQLRSSIVPSGPGREMCSIDFKAMDVCSMLAVVPGLGLRYQQTSDPHGRTASIIFEKDIVDDEERAMAKSEVFVHAYGGSSVLRPLFERHLPELNFLRNLPHGEGARRVQAMSARAFRAGLSKALPLLVYDDVMPVMAVHDELVLDFQSNSAKKVEVVARAIETGARNSIGQAYGTSVTFGANYAECKHKNAKTVEAV